MKAVVVFHGDCDGVIAAGLYIRHFLMDYYPVNVKLKFTQPWRIIHDLESTLKQLKTDEYSELVILDLAISDELAKFIKDLASKSHVRITVIDHHISSADMVQQFDNYYNIRIYWDAVQSTPQVLTKIIKNLNNYEEFLVEVANVCEGGEAKDQIIQQVADKIKLVLALDPTDSIMFYQTVKGVVEGTEFWYSEDFEKKFWRAKWLLNMLIKTIERKASEVCGWSVAAFTMAESLIYAGLFGIAASEYVKKHHKPLALVRSEGKKVVITIRSAEGQALELCRAVANSVPNTFYGGHREAASITIYGEHDLNAIVETIFQAIRTFRGCTV
ncbi:MAG TPA: hypothetical protein ENF93_00540 [Ignisphaera sp.]|nr:hypothetical protein [Ignisphaera sp.]